MSFFCVIPIPLTKQLRTGTHRDINHLLGGSSNLASGLSTTFPIKDCESPVRFFVRLPEGIPQLCLGEVSTTGTLYQYL